MTSIEWEDWEEIHETPPEVDAEKGPEDIKGKERRVVLYHINGTERERNVRE